MGTHRVALVRILRRHAYLMTGTRTVGDEFVVRAFGGVGRSLLRDGGLAPALRMLYRCLPRRAVSGGDAAVAALRSLPFLNRGAVILIVIQNLSLIEAGYVLGIPADCVPDLLSVGRELVGLAQAATAPSAAPPPPPPAT
ncbi:hypothetical protein [Caenispirillum bisanense]|uniref:Sigma-70, region 4 n=1 Tax=Caenispirillum bisanense TaxID=414052 RepID=A0A286G6D9_9PROT|nr:hypothetical protein [Caenispirillum bisanense]SOD91073.1 hypothetical protein SAMN05421508_101795 [Caenispirillum bisanense]